MIFFTLIIFLGISLIFPLHTHAIIVLPAIILIPLAQLVATIVGFLSIPIAGLGLLIKKITNNHRLAVKISLLCFVLMVFAATLILRYFYPDNPWL